MRIASRYSWMAQVEGAPKMILEAVKLGKLDTTEVPGPKSNAEIMNLASEAGVANIYKSDETAWCALAATVIALRAGKNVPFIQYDRLRARSFLKFGNEVPEPMYGDVCVFKRSGGEHVGIYVGEDATHYHVAGGNQGNEFSVIRIVKSRLLGARRAAFKTGQPAGVQKIFLEAEGTVSDNEA